MWWTNFSFVNGLPSVKLKRGPCRFVASSGQIGKNSCYRTENIAGAANNNFTPVLKGLLFEALIFTSVDEELSRKSTAISL